MTPTALELTRLLGSKELTRGCILENGWASERNPGRFFEFLEKRNGHVGFALGNGKKVSIIDDKESKTEIIGHPVTISDFHGWLVDKCLIFEQRALSLVVKDLEMNLLLEVSYLSNKKLLDQSEETLSAILNLVKSHAK